MVRWVKWKIAHLHQTRRHDCPDRSADLILMGVSIRRLIRCSVRVLAVIFIASMFSGVLQFSHPRPRVKPVAASETRSDQIGIAGNAFPWDANWDSYRDHLQQTNAGWARLEFRWEMLEPQPGEYHWHHADKLVGAYDEVDVKKLGLIVYSVGWANGNGGSAPFFGPPTDLDAWERFIRDLVQRYGDRVEAWEIWNEPDVSIFWNGIDGGQPEVYLELLKRAHRAIKSADPDAVVLNGGVSGTERGANFLHRLLDLGGGDYLDAIGIHGYVPKGEIDSNSFRSYHWKKLQTVYERSGKPFWVTEFGWATGYTGGSDAESEEHQASLIARHLPMLFDLGGVERVFVFQLRDPVDVPDYYGLIRGDTSMKPAYTVVKTIGNVTAGLRFERRIDLGLPDVWSMRFSGPDRTVDIVWSQSGSRQISFPTGQSEVFVWNLDGSRNRHEATQGSVALQIGIQPALVERAGPAPAGGPGRCRYFSETDQVLCDGFLDFWMRYGGLTVFGFPLSAELHEDGQLVQYFERAKFEYQPDSIGTEWAVVGEHVGRAVTSHRTGEAPFLPVDNAGSDSHCRYYPESRHRLCGGFRNYWDANGGLWLFGFPISEEFEEGGYLVQYFERARFELHPENAGTPYYVLLGHLGRELYEARY